MIEKEVLKRLPVEFQHMKPSKKKAGNGKHSTISVQLLQTHAAAPDNFYRPVSKYLNFNNE